MSGTHHQLLYHLVFSTKCRSHYLQSKTRARVLEYLEGTVNGLEGIPICIGGWVDHVHLLVKLKTNHMLSDFMRELKSRTSKHVNETSGLIYKFGWQDGYGAFSVSPGAKDAVVRYIENQERHHAKESFQQEYVSMLMAAGVEYDERFLWD